MDIVEILADSLRAGFGPLAAAYALSTIGLNLHYGYTGLLNFGHIAFMMVGAYGTAITVDQGGPLWLGILIGMGCAVVLGLLFGIPTLRLRVDYLAIVTIAAGEVLRTIVRSGDRESLTGGVFGITQFAGDFYSLNPFADGRYGWGRFSYSQRQLWVAVVAWGLVVLATLVISSIATSPFGRVLRSIREDEDASRSLGKDVFAYKLQALVVGGVIAGLAGTMIALERSAVHPDSYLPVGTFTAYVVLLLGGAGTRLGPIMGAVIYWFLFEFTDGFLRGALAEGWIPGSIIDSTDIGPIRLMLVGLGLMALMIFRPQGILGNREEVLLSAR
ncbi:MAG TPA: branched-chain amino acid ABC transporter permease [Acidimicrobiia bacterium]|nr:branched-chain amino acid ABC transporter permease [Acidimicrobiia bacterium]